MTTEIVFEAPGILRAQSSLVTISRATVDQLREPASQSHLHRSRICTHPDDKSRVQEMIIRITPESYVRPHKHIDVYESLHVLSGRSTLVTFDDGGGLLEMHDLAPYAENGTFYYRVAPGLFHSLFCTEEEFIFHEVVEGPFDRSKTIFAPWSPDSGSRDEGLAWLRAQAK